MKIEVAPHLKEVSELYKKVLEFESAVKLVNKYNHMKNAYCCYMEDDIDTVVDAFSKNFSIDPEESVSIKEAMSSGKIDFMRLPSDKEAVPKHEFQLLYIISRPFFKSMKNAMNVDNIYWEEGRCPVCNAVPSLSILEKESQRKFVCSFCGSVGYFMRIGCPNCLTENSRDITIIILEGEEGMRADTCDKCKSYCKTFESELILEHSLDLLDIMSLPLDIIVQEKGFKRHSPNPVGMIKMS